ncbi:hypothetical protein G3I38_27035, partial [Streptomyces sp. SID7958]|nr:hypothetical protein [Streptomyces sp. SID7958]
MTEDGGGAVPVEARGEPVGAGVPHGVGRVRVSAAATDLVTGEGVRCGGGVFVSASVVKADILAALLLRAQDSGRGPTAAERSLAAAMIERSDNDAASVLWRTV